MKKIIGIALLILATLTMASAQEDSLRPKLNPYQKGPKKPITDKFYFGGNLGLTFGSYTSISIWPMVGYKISPKFSAGLQPGLDYIKYNYQGYTDESSSYGIKIFSRYRIIPQFYLHAEYDYINYEIYTWINQTDFIKNREFVPFLFLGGGLSQQLGENSWMYVQILFDVLQDENSPYSSGEPFYSIGFGVGF